MNGTLGDYESIYEGEEIDEGIGKALTALQPGEIDGTLSQSGKAADAKAAGDAIAARYEKPSGGIPATDMSDTVRTALSSAGTALQPRDIDSTLAISGRPADAKAAGDRFYNMLPVETVEGPAVNFNNTLGEMPLSKCEVRIEPAQSGSGDPSPDNIRPITGRTAVNITVSPTAGAQDGETYTVSLGSAGTVYGGTLNIVTGNLSVDKVMKTFDGTENWVYVATGKAFNRVYVPVDDIDLSVPDNAVADIMCDRYTAVNYQSGPNNGGISGRYNIGQINVFQNEYSSKNEFTAALSSEPLHVVYKLADPIIYSLTPCEITALSGENHIWSDAGDISVGYKTDIQTYIDRRTAELQALILDV